MLNDINDPLTAYVNVFRDRFKNVAENSFAELATEAKVDIEANHETCKQIYATEDSLSTVKTRLNRWDGVGLLLWLFLIGCVIAFFAMHQTLDTQGFTAMGITVIIAIVLLYFKVRPQLKKLKGEEIRLTEIVDKLKNEAWEQMSPLNRLYDGDIFTRMMTQTIPRLEFDP